jgi:hypothetical protein
MFCPVLSLEEAPALCLPQVRCGPPIVSGFLEVVYRIQENKSILFGVLTLLVMVILEGSSIIPRYPDKWIEVKEEVEEEEEEENSI